MKTKKLIKKLYRATLDRNPVDERRVWLKLIRKSLKHKHTESVQ